MSVYSRNPEESTACSFCDERNPAPAAFWMMASGELVVCRHCALNVLPAIIADAVVQDQSHGYTLSQVNDALQEIELRFWRACFLSVLRSKNNNS
jgi:hypothetical protein